MHSNDARKAEKNCMKEKNLKKIVLNYGFIAGISCATTQHL